MEAKKKGSTRTPVQARSQETKQRIIMAARTLFGRQGYHGTTSKEIAREAGVAIGSFYSYYSEKGPLFVDVVEIFYNDVLDTMKSRISIPDALPNLADPERRGELIKLFIRSLYAAHELSPSLHREISAMALRGNAEESSDPTSAGICAIVAKTDQAVFAWLRSSLESLQPLLRPQDLDVAAQLVFRTAEETVHRLRMYPSTSSDPEALLSELETMLCRYLFI